MNFFRSDYIYILEVVSIWSIFKNLNGILLVLIIVIVNIFSGMRFESSK